MKTTKWVGKNGEARVYVSGFQATGTCYAIDDGSGSAKVVVEGATKKGEGMIISAVRTYFGFYADFSTYLESCQASEPKIDKSYGSKWANGFSQANGYDHDES